VKRYVQNGVVIDVQEWDAEAYKAKRLCLSELGKEQQDGERHRRESACGRIIRCVAAFRYECESMMVGFGVWLMAGSRRPTHQKSVGLLGAPTTRIFSTPIQEKRQKWCASEYEIVYYLLFQ
jgi:hypothetical protein